MSDLTRTIRLALKSLMLHKLRSGLTMLGIVFGVFSVIAMLAIGEGASNQAQEQVRKLGATNVIVRTKKPPRDLNSGSGGRRSRILIYGLLRRDHRALEKLQGVRNAIPIRELMQEARVAQFRENVRLVGCTPEYQSINHLQIARGKFLSQRHRELRATVCVLAAEVADRLFPLTDPLGERIVVGKVAYEIIGVMKPRGASAAVGGSLAAQDYSQDVYIPIETLWARLTDQVISLSSGSFSAEQVELSQITLQVGDEKQVRPVAEAVSESLAMRHADDSDYAIVVPLELLEQAKQIRQIFNIVLGSIAAISLVVGGIGIMNIMLATVTERTREIGVRRALGATQKDITVQFLTETIVLAGTGGLIGVVLGLSTPFVWIALKAVLESFVGVGAGGSEMSRMFLNMTPQINLWSLPLSFGISVGIGVGFGLYPARSAARLDPIEALRHE